MTDRVIAVATPITNHSHHSPNSTLVTCHQKAVKQAAHFYGFKPIKAYISTIILLFEVSASQVPARWSHYHC